ncbi:glycerol kinase [bacterium SCGC AG-212-C10]|nr:glycerol kinase [bacterium SCGC AG-212-C10]
MAAHVLAIDQGTTSSRALVVDDDGRITGKGQRTFTQFYPEPGLVEHDANEIWETTLGAIDDALKAAAVNVTALSAVGITNQRETIVVWDRASGEPVAPAIVWQDRRTAALCAQLRSLGHEPSVAHTTGLTLDPYFSGTKLMWLFRSDTKLRERAEAGHLAAGTIDSWLIWKLTAGQRHVTDYTNASRTLLFNVRRGRWDEDMLSLFEVPKAILPVLQPSGSRFGVTDTGVIGAAIPILGVAGDQQSALFGQACFAPNQAKNTYGTGCFLLAGAGAKAPAEKGNMLLSLGARSGRRGPEYVIEGSVFVAGAAIQWLRDELAIVHDSAAIEALAASVPDTGGVAFVPAFTGLGAPDWDPYARGAIMGLTRGSTKAHIARAALEAIALSSAELLDAVGAVLAAPIAELRVDGGASANDLLMQMQADFAGVPVVRPAELETTALGAAYLAGIGAGIWESEEEVAELVRPGRIFEPAISDDDRAFRRAQWRRAVERTRGWAEPQ